LFIAISRGPSIRSQNPFHYNFLAQLVSERSILLTAPDVDVSAVLSMMALTTSESQLEPSGV
jgi:hypothetical protein